MDTTYGADLEKIKVELANHRSEMANLAQQTVADLEPKIPILQAKINTLTAEVGRLDTLIATKTKQSEYDENYWKSHYEALEVALNKAHDDRTATIEAKDKVYAGKDKEYANKEVDFKSRENDIQDALRRLTALDKELDEKRMDFEQEKSDHEKNAKEIMSNLNGHVNEANSEKLKQKSITENIEKKLLELADKIKQADAVIARIGEAQDKLNEARKLVDDAYEKEEKIKKQFELLEISKSELKEKNVILASRSSRLDQQEARLHKRIRYICSLEEQRQLVEEDKNARATS